MMTCRRRPRGWNEAGVWSRLHGLLFAEPHSAGSLDWDRAVIGTSHIRAARRGPRAGRARRLTSPGVVGVVWPPPP
ncbi:hypothetical protein BN6_45380 [Saccharothrix espanaensis DSM 44229]|uniref:Uncharacterized protein n=1 Tax=Saccharothrix espanaensis (strain ATCC 51144 / DSM 44229 / JCM 9112 / NBRC 15066 / NRRL 15764) TaxID=1179773 RepID=K0K5I1_SACES|nr:hypothetical protein BN6_45380 [Saccharothrix espanaensis DSM 44229]